MYYDYFGLKQAPFKITPDTSLFFPGGNRGAVLEALIYSITQGEGIVKVVGEVGTGKTMLCRMLEVELPENVEVVYLANPSLSPENILHAIAFELELDVTETDNRLKVMNELQKYLLDRHADNRQIVVFVEEAQGMPIATLEEIRLLSNLETTQNKLLQIVLFGQPELDEKIATREIRQLKERITYSFQLAPFKKDDIKDYLNARMRTCGYRSEDIFTSTAVSAISKYSKGLVRRINILADKALLAAYAGNTHKVTSSHVKIAARDSEFLNRKTILIPTMVSMAGLILLILIGSLVFPGKINQGVQVIQKSFSTFTKPTSIQIEDTSTLTENQTLVERAPDDTLSGVSTLEQSTDVEVTESSSQDEQFETIYLPQDREVLTVSSSAKIGQTDVTSTDDNEILDLHALIKGKIISSPSDLDAFIKDGNTQESTSISEKEDVSLIFSEPSAIGMTEQEFERFKQQLMMVPPEVNLDGTSGDGCEKCASIIYRPIL